MLSEIFISFFLSLIISGIFAFSIYKFGLQLGLTDVPNIRSSHKNPIPRGGGIGIPVAVFFIAILFARPLFLFISIQVFLAFFILIDDRRGLPVPIKFFAGVFVSLFLILAFKNEFLTQLSLHYGLLLTVLITLLISVYIVSSANFFNFMDGINGMAGLISIISFGFLTLYSHIYLNSDQISIITISITGGSIGFILFNFPKPKVFMGDSGSIFTGFLFASIVVLISDNLKDILLLSLFQGVFIIDCISTIFLRMYKKENIFKPHLRHLYQVLVHNFGFSHVKVTLIYSCLQVVLCILVLITSIENTVLLASLWITLFALYWIVRIKLDPINN